MRTDRSVNENLGTKPGLVLRVMILEVTEGYGREIHAYSIRSSAALCRFRGQCARRRTERPQAEWLSRRNG